MKEQNKPNLNDPAVRDQIETDFASAEAAIKAKMELANQFEDLVNKSITAHFCPGCEHFQGCIVMKRLHRFDRVFCRHPEREAIIDSFARGLAIEQAVEPTPETFSGN